MNLGMPEMMFIFIVALIIFGPKKLPEIGRQIGKAMNDFKRASNDFKSQIEAEISQLDLHTTILPPADPPLGVIASRAMNHEPVLAAEVASLPEASPVSETSPMLEANPVSETSPMLEASPVSKAPDA
jgi:sec-independent protein translocase protein TatB